MRHLRPSSFLRMPRLGGLWWLVLAFWVFLGFVIANQIFFGMLDHEHSWWRLFLWQAGACALWTPFVPLVFGLARSFPLGLKVRPYLVHAAAAMLLAAVHLVPVTLLMLVLDPYAPVSEATSFVDEYEFMMLHWFGQDAVIYVALLALAAIVDFRERQKNRRLRQSVLEAELARAELRALRLELQPHFIFNALNAVVGLLRREDPADAEKMLIGLSELLRRTLDGRGRQCVPLVEELRLVRLYLDIERIRFGDRFEVSLEAEPGSENASVPSLLLQPLVENAVRHGVARHSGRGRVGVHARRSGDRLVLRVTDDGPGPETAEAGHGVGLDNVSSRLEALYGRDWELALGSGAEGGTEVRIELPWRLDVPEATEPGDGLVLDGWEELRPSAERAGSARPAAAAARPLGGEER